ncbi:MAG: M20/M25/M40 family metallo-hydrolase [Spirochaetaceae bacterium]|nr:M20/M25/M40 family metallo-hydrolase [Spirochaetaceae bacterium]
MFNWQERIEPLFLHLIASRSDTNTPYESFIEEIILNWLKSRPYFQKYPEYLGSKIIKGDPHNREIIWALLKGESRKTIILIHHHDTVGIEDYGKLKNLALRPDDLIEALKKRKLPEQCRADLDSGEWLFARGAADMKSGAAIQMALLDRLSEEESFTHNILLISLPDEENLSRGMLEATTLIREISETYALDYILTINSEPYFNQLKKKAIIYEGSVGKIMPIIYVRGVRSHIGEPFNGLNPSLILAKIQLLSELNIDLCDQFENDATPPPIWVNLKDRKKTYDASIPEAATGYFNWLTFTKNPVDIMKWMMELSGQAMKETLELFNRSYMKFCKLNHQEADFVPFEDRVIDFNTLYKEALLNGESDFLSRYGEKEIELNNLLVENRISLPDAAIQLLEFTADEADLEGPAIVIGLSGPYYPHITNSMIPEGLNLQLGARTDRISRDLYNIEYQTNAYFMGICDLSYAGWVGDNADIESIKLNSPGWDTLYHIPFEDMKTLKAPMVNIGPWGKDLHKPTERVYMKDVYERIPEILYRLMGEVFEESKN